MSSTTIGVDDYQNFGSNLYVYRGTSFFVSYLVRMLFNDVTQSHCAWPCSQAQSNLFACSKRIRYDFLLGPCLGTIKAIAI